VYVDPRRGFFAMAGFRLLLLGPVRLLGPRGLEVAGVGAKAQALLAYVAAQPHRRAGREHLAQLLWEGDDSRHALRQALLVLRRRLGDDADGAIRSDGAAVALGPAVETDLARFETELHRGLVDPACARWQGPFCDGLDVGGEAFEDWLRTERARQAERAAWAFGRLARQAEAEGRIGVAVAAARRLVELDPLNDAAQATLIALYRKQGCAGAARLAHRRCVGLFHRELGIAPGAEVQAAARLPAVSPPPPDPRPNPVGEVGWRRMAAGAAGLLLVAILAGGRAWLAPEPAAASSPAWVTASEWRADARPDSGGVPLAEAIARGLAGDPEFAHLVPGGC
jgi:DNA-binding SARP family transcriptional activator